MNAEQALIFAKDWVDSWNAHDVERVLCHFTDDVVFTSPLAVTLINEPSGRVTGKAALRAYWTQGLESFPDLHFALLGVDVGVNMIVIRYRNHKGRHCSEVLELNSSGLAVRGFGAYEAQ